MASKRTYRTDTGDFSEEELSVLIWLNPEHAKKPQTRLLETLTSRYSTNPMAFPTATVRKTLTNYTIATESDIATQILDATYDIPLVVSLPIAQKCLGWADFFVSTSFEA